MCLSLGKTKRGWGTVTGINGRGGRRGSVRVDRRVLHCSKIVYEMEPGAELPFIGHRQHYSTKMREELEDGQQLREQVTGGIHLESRSAVNQSVHISRLSNPTFCLEMYSQV